MKKRIVLPTALFAAVFSATLLCGILLTYHTPTLCSGAEIPWNIETKDYIITAPAPLEAEAFSVALLRTATTPPLSLLLSDIASKFTLYCNEQMLYSFDPSNQYQRIHVISLEEQALGSGVLHIRLEGYTPSPADKFLIGTSSNIQKNLRFFNSIEMMTLGIYISIIFYSLSLYHRKKSEKYLLLLLVLAMIALISAFSNSSYPIWPVLLNQPVRFFRIVFCMVICFRINNIALPKKWNKLLSNGSMLALTTLLVILDSLRWTALVDILSYSLAVPAAIAVIMGVMKKENCSWLLLCIAAVREGLRFYFWAYSSGVLIESTPVVYYYLPQFSSMIFVVACMIKINDRFALKFNRADDLTTELAEINANLDTLIQERTKKLEESNLKILEEQENKNRLMTHIFHDLRSPIFSAMGSAEMLVPKDAKNAKYLHIIRNRLDYLNHLTEELFLLSKLEEKSITFEHMRIKIDSLCQTLCNSFLAAVEQKEITLTLTCKEEVYILGDSYHVKKAIENLISNAIQYTPKQGRIHVDITQRDGCAEIIIQDSGCGIAPEKIPYIFNRYYGGGTATSSGLGLYIAQQVVALHKGTLRLESKLGIGTVFYMQFPLYTQD